MPGAKSRLLKYFKANAKKPLSKDKLAKVADVFDWQRSIRSLRQEGWDIQEIKSGTKRGYYVLYSLRRKKGKIRGGINSKLRYKILQRDGSKCRRCGRSTADEVKLVIDHKIPVEMGGSSKEENLWTLCEECNLGKKHWFADMDVHVMQKIFTLKSGYRRLLEYFKAYPNQLLDISNLDLISGIRDWERTLRKIRQDEGMNIVHVRSDPKTGKQGYIYKKS